MLKVQVHKENRQLEIGFTVNIPEEKSTTATLICDAYSRQKARVYDILGAFSTLLIDSLQRRMKACESNLLAHLSDIQFADEFGHIEWSNGSFNVSSYEEMEKAIKALKESQWETFLNSRGMLDQTIKALINDDELQNRHEKHGGFKFSELVSILVTNLEGNFQLNI